MVIAHQRRLPTVPPVEAAPEVMEVLAATVVTAHTRPLHLHMEAVQAIEEAGAGVDLAEP